MVCVALAAFVGVYVTEQLVGLLAPASAQVVLLKVPMPTVFEKVTVPVGAEAPVPVAVAAAVEVGLPRPGALGGLQLTAVVVLRLLTVTANVPLLVRCVLLPP